SLSGWLTFGIAIAFTVAGCGIAALSPLGFPTGFVVTATGWLLVALWLLVHDIAYPNLKRPNLPRFTSIGLLLGYGWLALGALIVLGHGGTLSGLAYDAALHAVFLGFVLSLVFAHAPVILPAVVGKPFPFRRVLYAPAALLHLSLAARVLADLTTLPLLREWAGLFNVVAIVLFGGLLATLYRQGESSLELAFRSGSAGFFP
ncbi:hypothetical protein B1B_13459, partial [mine drainage metagenome]